MKILVSGGPGSGCSTLGARIGAEFELAVFDSDTFFHKPSDPPFQSQYSPAERRALISTALDSAPRWIITGSVATWDLVLPPIRFGIFLNVPTAERMRRLSQREKLRFGDRIDGGGDLHGEHENFLNWAAGYETRGGTGRNRTTDRDFLRNHCENLLEIESEYDVGETATVVRDFLKYTM